MCPFHRHRYMPAFLKAPASFEVFESKLASRMSYGAGARYFFRQRERRFIGLSKRRTKFVFLDENGRHEDDIVLYKRRLERGARAASAALEDPGSPTLGNV